MRNTNTRQKTTKGILHNRVWTESEPFQIRPMSGSAQCAGYQIGDKSFRLRAVGTPLYFHAGQIQIQKQIRNMKQKNTKDKSFNRLQQLVP